VITHHAAVAAQAHQQLSVRKASSGKRTVMTVCALDEAGREDELARMAAGDLARDEAAAVARALRREGNRRDTV
jgi:DNA repair ATPase RecN